MLNEIVLILFYVAILIYSVILHEVSHGVMALWLGDATAKYAGRITANPFKHIDPWMTIGMPIMMLLLTGFAFDVFDHLADGLKFFGIGLGDFALDLVLELFFEGHD